jgi:cytochrome c2
VICVLARSILCKSLRATARGLLSVGRGLTVLAAVSGVSQAEDAERGRDLARSECGACHHMGQGPAEGAGPTLNGIVGRPAAAIADYPYSDGLKAAAARGVVWYPDDIKDYLVPGQTYVPDSAMGYAGLPGQVDRDDVAAYLATLAVDGSPR